MGQYYKVYLEKPDGTVDALDRTTNGKYVMAKLTEHSWVGNPFVNTVSQMIYHEPTRVAWVGDYADGTSAYRIEEIYPIAWSEKAHGVTEEQLTLNGKVFVNHTRMIYMDYDEYYKRSNHNSLGDGWVMHPLPLLTAVGNGLGGGDYRGVNKNDIGDWYLDLISIEDKAPDGYTPIEYTFYETF